jgi:hypothetical protein
MKFAVFVSTLIVCVLHVAAELSSCLTVKDKVMITHSLCAAIAPFSPVVSYIDVAHLLALYAATHHYHLVVYCRVQSALIRLWRRIMFHALNLSVRLNTAIVVTYFVLTMLLNVGCLRSCL